MFYTKLIATTKRRHGMNIDSQRLWKINKYDLWDQIRLWFYLDKYNIIKWNVNAYNNEIYIIIILSD